MSKTSRNGSIFFRMNLIFHIKHPQFIAENHVQNIPINHQNVLPISTPRFHHCLVVPHRATGSGCCRKRPDQCLASSLEECRRTTLKDTKIFVYFVCLLSCSQVYPSLVVKLRVKHVQVKGKFPPTCQETARKIYKNNYINQKSSTAIFNKNTYTTCPVFHQIWYLNHGTIAEAGVQTAVVSC